MLVHANAAFTWISEQNSAGMLVSQLAAQLGTAYLYGHP